MEFRIKFESVLYSLILVFFVLLVFITFVYLYESKVFAVFYYLFSGLSASFLLMIFLYFVATRRKKSFSSILRTLERYILLLASSMGFMVSLLLFIGKKVYLTNLTFGDILALTSLLFMSVFIVYYLTDYLTTLHFLSSIGLTESYVKEIHERLKTTQIKDRLILVLNAIDVFISGRYLSTIFIISNFFEEIINIWYFQNHSEKCGFKKKVKILNINVKDPVSHLTLDDFYYSIRSKYAHKIYKREVMPSTSEVKASLRLLKRFLETLPIVEQRGMS